SALGQIHTRQASSRAGPTQLAMAVLTVSQRQLHDFKVVRSIQIPVGDGRLVTIARTVIASTGRDRTIRIGQANRSAVATIRVTSPIPVDRGFGVAIQEGSLEAREVRGGV